MAASVSRALKAPATAVTWSLKRVIPKGQRGKAKVEGEPLADGSVPDRWAVSEFSTQSVLEQFGPDIYVVSWFDATGKRISGQTFTVAHPPAHGARLRKGPRAPSRDEREDDREERREPRGSSGGDSFSFKEFLAMQEQTRRESEAKEERADARRREEALAAQTRDREFMGMVFGMMQQTRSDPAVASDLLRRELKLEIRQEMHALRNQLGELEPDEPEPGDPPADLEEGVSRVGAALLGELEQRAPHLVNELIPQVAAWLKSKGYTPSEEVQTQIAAGVVRGRNGAGQG